MVNKITNWTPFYLEPLPKTQLRDKVLINGWFVSECLWSNPKAPVYAIKDFKWIEKDTSTYCRTIQMATAIALAFILHKRPVLGGVLIALSAVPKGAIRYLAKNEISKFKQSPIEGARCKAMPYLQEERKLLVQDYVKVLPHGISIHFGGIDYGTHPDAQKGVHTEVFETFSNKLAEMGTLTAESCDEAVSILYETFNTHINGFEEKNTKTTNRISELLDKLIVPYLTKIGSDSLRNSLGLEEILTLITDQPPTKETFNELRDLLELDKLKTEDCQGDDLKKLINALKSNNYDSIAKNRYNSRYVTFFQERKRTYKTHNYGDDPRQTPFGCAVFYEKEGKHYLYTASSEGVDYYICNGTGLPKKAQTKVRKLYKYLDKPTIQGESIEVQPGDTVISLSGELAKGGADTAKQILAGTLPDAKTPGGFTVMRLRPDINAQ